MCEEGIDEDEDGRIPDDALMKWLKGIQGEQDRRTLNQVMNTIRWPVASNQTLAHQSLIFMRSCHKILVVDSDALERFGDKKVIKALWPKLPRALKAQTRDHFELQSSEAEQKHIKHF